MEEYKQDIISTRNGCVGSSDGAMLERIARDGKVPSAYARRLAVIKGIVPSVDGVKTRAMELGDMVEQEIFRILSEQGEGYESNPKWVSDIYKRKNVTLISHPDIVRADTQTRTLHVYEVKTTRFNLEDTERTYLPQLYVHHLLAREQADVMEGAWTVKVYLVHYQTDGTGHIDRFEPSCMTVLPVDFSAPIFDMGKAMDILDETLEDFTYEEQEEESVESLPEYVRGGLAQAAMLMDEIKVREEQIAEFKATLYDFMCRHNIKSVRNDYFSVTRVDPTESVSFDSRSFLAYIRKHDPQWAEELEAKYRKVTKRSGYALIKLR